MEKEEGRKVLPYERREELKKIAYELRELGYEKEAEDIVLIAHWQRYLDPVNENKYLTLEDYKQWRKENPNISY